MIDLETFVRFCGLLEHPSGTFAGRPSLLEPWQEQIMGEVSRSREDCKKRRAPVKRRESGGRRRAWATMTAARLLPTPWVSSSGLSCSAGSSAISASKAARGR